MLKLNRCALFIAGGLLAAACDSATGPSESALGPSQEVAAVPGQAGGAAEESVLVQICHRTRGRAEYRLLQVAEAAVESHLAHGDGRVGDAVPGQPGMQFSADCQAVQSRVTTAISGRWTGSIYYLSTFTISAPGPVDVAVTVTGYVGEMRVALLGYNPEAPVSTCSTAWLSIPVPIGPDQETPDISAHWDEIPPGTYCVNVVSTTPVPPYPEPYSWTGTVTHP